MSSILYVKQPNLLVGLIESALEPFKKEIEIAFIFGSLAKGNFLINSDVDIFIVSDNKIIDQIRTILDEILVDKGIRYDLIFMTQKEYTLYKELSIIKEASRGLKLWEKERSSRNH